MKLFFTGPFMNQWTNFMAITLTRVASNMNFNGLFENPKCSTVVYVLKLMCSTSLGNHLLMEILFLFILS